MMFLFVGTGQEAGADGRSGEGVGILVRVSLMGHFCYVDSFLHFANKDINCP